MDLSHPPLHELAATSAAWAWRARPSGRDLVRARSDEYRDPWARDRARLQYCQAARRLMGQAQVAGLLDAEVPRSRLTGVLEVAQLARGMLRALQNLYPEGERWRSVLPDINLLEALAFGRALGHTPFGGTGAQALAACLHGQGGPATGLPVLRRVALLEAHTPGHGLDLTRRTLMGLALRPLLTHPAPAGSPGDAGWLHWLLAPLSACDVEALCQPAAAGAGATLTLEASMVELAEGLAEGVHQLDDAWTLGALRAQDLSDWVVDPGWAQAVGLDLAALGPAMAGPPEGRRQVLGALVNALLVSVEIESDHRLDEPLLRYRAQWMPAAAALLAQLRDRVRGAWARLPQVAAAQAQGDEALRLLWDRGWDVPEALGLTLAPDCSGAARARALAEHLSGLTDAQALRLAAALRGH